MVIYLSCKCRSLSALGGKEKKKEKKRKEKKNLQLIIMFETLANCSKTKTNP